MHCVEVLQGGCNVENSPAPQRSCSDRSDNDRDKVCNDLRLDGEWKHHRVCEGTPGCKPFQAGGFSIQILIASGALRKLGHLSSWKTLPMD